jgi:hypothetical protein
LPKHYIESIFTGAFVLVIGLTFGGFKNDTLPPAEAHQNEIARMESVLVPTEITMIDEVEPVAFERKYKKNEQLSAEELKDILYSVGFRGERLREAWAVAMKESTGRPRSHNDNPATGDNSYGLFQINMIGDLGPARLKQFGLEENSDLFDPVRNAEIAFFMSNGGKIWSSWNGIGQSTTKWFSEYPG